MQPTEPLSLQTIITTLFFLTVLTASQGASNKSTCSYVPGSINVIFRQTLILSAPDNDLPAMNSWAFVDYNSTQSKGNITFTSLQLDPFKSGINGLEFNSTHS